MAASPPGDRGLRQKAHQTCNLLPSLCNVVANIYTGNKYKNSVGGHSGWLYVKDLLQLVLYGRPIRWGDKLYMCNNMGYLSANRIIFIPRSTCGTAYIMVLKSITKSHELSWKRYYTFPCIRIGPILLEPSINWGCWPLWWQYRYFWFIWSIF